MVAYKKLGLIGDNNNAVLLRKDVDYPTDHINIPRMLDGHQDCFVQVVPVNVAEAEKKKIIVTDWSYRHDMAADNSSIISYLEHLIEDGFEVYVWSGELTRVKTKESLETYLKLIEPIHRQSLKQKLPALHLSADECHILDCERLNHDVSIVNNHKKELFSVSINSKIPAKLLEELLNTITDENPVELRINSPLSGKQIDVINRFLESHHSLNLAHWMMPEHLTDLLNLRHLRHLKITKSVKKPEHLTSILKETTQLESLDLELFWNRADKIIAHGFPKLPQLKSLKTHTDISEHDLETLLQAVPNLEKLSILIGRDSFAMKENLETMTNLKELHFSKMHMGHPIGALVTLLKHAPNLKKIHLQNHSLDQNLPTDLSLHDLEILKLEECNVSELALNLLTTKAASLKELEINHSSLPENWSPPAQLINLERLVLTGTKISGTTFDSLGTNLPKLKLLKITSDNTNITSSNNFDFPEVEYLEIDLQKIIGVYDLETLIKKMPKLKEIMIHYPGGNFLKLINPHAKREISARTSGTYSKEDSIEYMLTPDKGLTSLDLVGMEFTDGFYKNMTSDSNSTLENLDLTSCKINASSLQSLLKNMQQLKALNMTSAKIHGLNDQSTAPNSSLRELKLSRATIEDTIGLLRNSPNLKKLDLSNSTLKGYGPVPLKELEILDASYSTLSISDIFVLLKQTPKLKSLTARHLLTMSDYGGANLGTSTLAELETLDLSDAPITSEELYEILKHTPKLKTLILTETRALTDGFPAAIHLPELEILTVNNSAVSNHDINLLLSSSSKLKKLNASNINFKSYPFPITTIDMPELYDIDLQNTGIRTVQLEDLLQRAPQLHTLNITSCSNLNTNHEHINKLSLPKLEELHAGDSSASFTTISNIISDSPALTYLDISGIRNVGSSMYQESLMLPGLTTLQASGSSISPSHLAVLIKHSKNLQTLGLNDCKELNRDFADDLYCPNLRSVSLQNAMISAELLLALLADANNISALILDQATISDAKNQIEPLYLPYIQRLTVRNRLEAELLASLLHGAASLERLDLRSSILHGDISSTISCPRLTNVCLDSTTIGSEALSAILEKASTLSDLDLDNAMIKSDGFMLPVSLPELNTLRLNSTSLTGDQLAAILSDANTIKKLSFDKCRRLTDYTSGTISCRNLENISVNDSDMNAKLLSTLLSQGEKISSITIYGSNFTEHDIAPVNLPNLKNISIGSTNLTARQLTALLVDAQHLKQLVISHGKNHHDLTDNDIHEISCPELSGLTVLRAHISSRLLNSLLQSTNLSEFTLTKCKITNDQALTPAKLNELHTLNFTESQIDGEQLFSIINSAPNAKSCIINKCSIAGEPDTPLQNESFQNLNKLDLDNSTFSAKRLSEMLNHTPVLENLSMIETRIGYGDLNLEHHMPQLTEAYIQGCNITSEQLVSLFQQAPNLEQISVSGCHQLRLDQLGSTMPVMSKIFYFNIYNMRTSFEEIEALIAKLPSLRDLRIDSTQLTQQEIINLQKKYPVLKINSSVMNTSLQINSSSTTRVSSSPYLGRSMPTSSTYSKSATAPVHPISARQINLDSDIYYNKDKDTTLPVTQIFRFKNPNDPHPRDYRMNGFTEIQIGKKISLKLPEHPTMMPITVNTNRSDLSQLYEEKFAASDNIFFGEIDVKGYDWIPMPTLGARDMISQIETTPNVPVDIQYCVETGLYYIKSSNPVTKVHVSYLLKHDPALTEFPIHYVDIKDVTLGINQDGTLKCDAKTMARINAMNTEQKINFIASYLNTCSYNLDIKKESRKTEFKNDLEVIDEILKSHTGACRHTAMTFVVLAKSLGIKSRIISNQCHNMVEVMHENRLCRVELGGWPGKLNTSYLKNPGNLFEKPAAVVPQQQSAAAKTRAARRRKIAATKAAPANIPINDLTAAPLVDITAAASAIAAAPVMAPKKIPRVKTMDENRFAIWNKQISQAKNAGEYARELLTIAAEMKPGSKNILSMLQPDKIESLHKAMLEQTGITGNKCFYVHHLDDIRTSCYAINNGTYSVKDSELIRFIKQAKTGDVLMVNWSDYEAKHVGQNTMLDLTRTIQGINIPEGVTIIGVLDKSITLGEDFYSRNRFKSNAPGKIEAGNVITPLKTTDTSAFTEIVFYDDQWKREILGEYKIGEEGFQFASSLLLDAITAGKSGVVLRNAPWYLQDFRLAITSLMQKRELFVNGEIFHIPEQFNITFNDEPLPLNIGKYQIIYPNGIPQNAYLLNQTTLQQFFGSYQCLPNNTLSSVPGILAQHHNETLSIYVSSQLTHAAWAKLLSEANEHHVQLKISSASGVDLPAEMKRHSSYLSSDENTREKSSFTASVIATNDITLALSQLSESDTRDAIIIPVNNLTSYSDLVERIRFEDHQGKKLFLHSTSVLADAAKSGKKIILTGTLSTLLASQLSTLFMPHPSLTINGKREDISSGKLTLISDTNPIPFINPELKNYSDDDRYAALTGDSRLIHLLIGTCEAFYRAAPSFEHFDFNQLSIMLSRLQNLPANNPLTPFIRLNAKFDTLKPLAQKIWQEQKHAKKPVRNEDPISKRLRKVEAELKESPFVFIAGSSGIGKSRFMQHDFKTLHGKPVKIYESMEKIHEWFGNPDDTSQHVLFLDEANLQAPGTFDLFAGLMRKPPVINIDGKLQPVPKNKKIVFAGNFRGYKNRLDHSFFHEFGHVITFKEFPDEYLRQHVIDPVLKKCMPQISKAALDHYAKIYLQTYHYLNQLFADTHPMTARNLQMMALRTIHLAGKPGALQLAIYDEVCGILNQKQRRDMRNWLEDQTVQHIDLKQIKHELKQHVAFNSRQFHLTKMRFNAVRQLDTLFALRDIKRTTPGLESAGTCGILFEGESGIGKSLMAMEYLNEHGFTLADNDDATPHDHRHYYHLTPTDPLKMQKILLKAFHEGAPVIIDELNSLPLENILNPLLSGVDLDGHPAKNPGFFVIGTQNPSSFVKRQVLSAALLNRLQFVDLKEYGFDDLLEITSSINDSTEIVEELTADYKSAKLFARQHHKSPEPTPRDLFSAAKGESPTSSPLSSSQEGSPELQTIIKASR